MEADERALREAHATWMKAVNAGDLALLLTMVTDDLVLLSPGQEPAGREGFAATFSGAHEQMRIHCRSEMEEVVVVGDVAYSKCRDTLSVCPRDGGEETRLAGYRLTVYRKSPEGRWLLARDAHTLAEVER